MLFTQRCTNISHSNITENLEKINLEGHTTREGKRSIYLPQEMSFAIWKKTIGEWLEILIQTGGHKVFSSRLIFCRHFAWFSPYSVSSVSPLYQPWVVLVLLCTSNFLTLHLSEKTSVRQEVFQKCGDKLQPKLFPLGRSNIQMLRPLYLIRSRVICTVTCRGYCTYKNIYYHGILRLSVPF